MGAYFAQEPCGDLLDPRDPEFSLNPRCGTEGGHRTCESHGIQWPSWGEAKPERYSKTPRSSYRSFVQAMHDLDVPMRRGIFLDEGKGMVRMSRDRFYELCREGKLTTDLVTFIRGNAFVTLLAFTGKLTAA